MQGTSQNWHCPKSTILHWKSFFGLNKLRLPLPDLSRQCKCKVWFWPVPTGAMSICSCCCFLWPPAEENQKEVMKVLYCGGTHGTNSQYWWVVTGLSPPMGRPSLVVTRGETQKAASVASMLVVICPKHALIFGQCSPKDLRWRIITAVLSRIQNTFNFTPKPSSPHTHTPTTWWSTNIYSCHALQ